MRRQHVAETESHVRLGDQFLLAEDLFHFTPTVGEAAAVKQEDARTDDAEVFQVRVRRKESEAPSIPARKKEPVEPFFQFLEAALMRQLNHLLEERALDPFGRLGYDQPSRPASNGNARGREGDAPGHEKGAAKAGLGEFFSADTAPVIEAKHIANM